MTNDGIRYNLVASLVCAKCGNKLAMSYEKPKSQGDYEPHTDDDITGAAKVQVMISVHPCKKCYTAAMKPLEALRDAFALVGKANP